MDHTYHPKTQIGVQALDVPVLVVSCDAYSDLWRPFFALFQQRWPDCPFPVYLGTNEQTFDHPRVTVLHSGPDRGWSLNLRHMLDDLGTDYVILFLEDFFLLRPVETDRFVKLVQIGVEHSVGCLRIYSILPPPHPLHDRPGLGGFEAGDPYRVTLQVSLWRVETLHRLLHPGLTPWQFEVIGTRLSGSFVEPFWGVYRPPVVYDHVIEKGRWKPSGLALCKEVGLEIDLSRRPAFTVQEWRDYNCVRCVRARLTTLRGQAVGAFMAGRRRVGLGLVVNCLCRRPFSIPIWTIGLLGLIGPRPLGTARRAMTRFRLAWIRLRYLFARRWRRYRAL